MSTMRVLLSARARTPTSRIVLTIVIFLSVMGPSMNAYCAEKGEKMKISKIKRNDDKSNSLINNKLHSLLNDFVSADMESLWIPRSVAAAARRIRSDSRPAGGAANFTNGTAPAPDEPYHALTEFPKTVSANKVAGASDRITVAAEGNKLYRSVHARKAETAGGETKKKNFIFQLFSDIDHIKRPRLKSRQTITKRTVKRNVTCGYLKRPVAGAASSSNCNYFRPVSSQRSSGSAPRLFGSRADNAVHETRIIKISPTKRKSNKRNGYESVRRPNGSKRWWSLPFPLRSAFIDGSPGSAGADDWELSASIFEEELLPFHERNKFNVEDVLEDETRNLFDDVFNLFRMLPIPLSDSVYIKISTTESPKIIYSASQNFSTDRNLHYFIENLRNKRQARLLASRNISSTSPLKKRGTTDDGFKKELSLDMRSPYDRRKIRVKKDNGSAIAQFTPNYNSTVHEDASSKNTTPGNAVAATKVKIDGSSPRGNKSNLNNTEYGEDYDVEFGFDDNRILSARRKSTANNASLTSGYNETNVDRSTVSSAKKIDFEMNTPLYLSPEPWLKKGGQSRAPSQNGMDLASINITDNRPGKTGVPPISEQNSGNDSETNDASMQKTLSPSSESESRIGVTTRKNGSPDSDGSTIDNVDKEEYDDLTIIPKLINLLDMQENEMNQVYEENSALKSSVGGGSEVSGDSEEQKRTNPLEGPETNKLLILLGLIPGVVGLIIIVGVALIWVMQKNPSWLGGASGSSSSPRNDSNFQTTQTQQPQKSSVQC